MQKSPIQALCESVRDYLRSEVPLRDEYCDNQIDGRPISNSGQYYVSVFPVGYAIGPSNDQHLGIDRMLTVGVGITQRTGYCPDDKLFRNALFTTKNTTVDEVRTARSNGVLSLVQSCDRAIRKNRYLISQTATAMLDNQNPADDTDDYKAGKICEPLRLQTGNIQVRAVNEPHFRAEPCPPGKMAHCQDFGLYAELVYGDARYLESFLTTG